MCLRWLRQAGALISLISIAFCVGCWSPLDEFWGMPRSEPLRDAKIGTEPHGMTLIKEVSEPYNTIYPEGRLSGDKWPHVEMGAVISVAGGESAQLTFFDNGPRFQIDGVGINGDCWQWLTQKFGRFAIEECWRPPVICYCDRNFLETGFRVHQVQSSQFEIDLNRKKPWQFDVDSGLGGEVCGFGGRLGCISRFFSGNKKRDGSNDQQPIKENKKPIRWALSESIVPLSFIVSSFAVMIGSMISYRCALWGIPVFGFDVFDLRPERLGFDRDEPPRRSNVRGLANFSFPGRRWRGQNPAPRTLRDRLRLRRSR
jgi:hypothetical protein